MHPELDYFSPLVVRRRRSRCNFIGRAAALGACGAPRPAGGGLHSHVFDAGPTPGLDASSACTLRRQLRVLRYQGLV